MSENAGREGQPDPARSARVLLFFDYACPFCYVDQFRFAGLAEEHPMELVLVPFELRPDTAGGGRPSRRSGRATASASSPTS